MARQNTVTLVLALAVMASLSAAVFFGVMEIQAKRLGSWRAAMDYPRPIIVSSDNTKVGGGH
jgi:hypothetical protein